MPVLGRESAVSAGQPAQHLTTRLAPYGSVISIQPPLLL